MIRVWESADADRLNGLQSRIGTWARATFPAATLGSVVTHLQEEAQELREAVEQSLEPASHDIQMEAADNLILVLHLAERLGFSVQEVAELHYLLTPFDSPEQGAEAIQDEIQSRNDQGIQFACVRMLVTLDGFAEDRRFSLLGAAERKFAELLTREWGEPDEKGVVRHIKPRLLAAGE